MKLSGGPVRVTCVILLRIIFSHSIAFHHAAHCSGYFYLAPIILCYSVRDMQIKLSVDVKKRVFVCICQWVCVYEIMSAFLSSHFWAAQISAGPDSGCEHGPWTLYVLVPAPYYLIFWKKILFKKYNYMAKCQYFIHILAGTKGGSACP